MQDLITVKKGKMFTNSKVVADAISEKKDQHRNVMDTLEKFIINSDLFSRSHSNANVTYTDNMGADIVFIETTYKTSRGNIYKMYEMNESGYQMLVSNLQRYKNAKMIQIQFIKAFNLMRKMIETQQSTIDHVVAEGCLPFDAKDTISIVNDLPRDKVVKSYYRSKRGKESKKLDKAIKKTQEQLFSFANDSYKYLES